MRTKKMKQTIRKNWRSIFSKSFLLILIFSMWSCKKDIIEVDEMSNEIIEKISKNEIDFNKFGKQLQNPYSLENMKRSIKKVLGEHNKFSKNLKASHYYIRFNIKTEKELSVLKQDSLLNLYDYPLDYDFENSIDLLNIKDIGEKFSAVKFNYKFPKNIDYDILDDLYIPEETNDFSNEISNKIVDEALKITNNIDEEISGRSRWNPKGKIEVWDDYYQSFKPVEGVKVKARRWFTTHSGITDSEGKYFCSSFRRPANYSIDWEKYNFKIRDSWLHGAKYNGPKRRGDWNLQLRGDKHAYYATIFKAAYYYYYKNIFGTQRPPQNSWFHTQLKIRADLEDDPNYLGICHVGHRFLGLGNHIKIRCYSFIENRSLSHYVYSTVIHELAHTAHWKLDRNNYNNAFVNLNTRAAGLPETWARGIEVKFTREIYPHYAIDYSRNDYTGIVEDLLDGTKFVRSIYYDKYGATLYKDYSDLVVGYDLKTLENALVGCRKFKEWELKIVYNYENSTENHVKEVFRYWTNK